MDSSAPNSTENKQQPTQNTAQPEQSTPTSAQTPQPAQTTQPAAPEQQSEQAQPEQEQQTTATNQTPPTDQPAQPEAQTELLSFLPLQLQQSLSPYAGQITPLLKIGKTFTKSKLFLPSIIIVIVIFCILIFALIFGKGSSVQTKTTAPKPTNAAIKKTAQKTSVINKSPTLVYGTWTSQSSVVRAVDLGTNTVKTVATLPLTIKKITVLSPDTLLYIDQTDKNDHGARISIYNIKEQQITTNIPAANGYGIDDYVLSPNKRYLALWEVQFSPTSNTLLGGASRVYSVDLTSPVIPNLLYDETTTTLALDGTTQSVPIHYPRAILDNGTVLTDQMIANDPSGAGWAYGMSVVDFDGSNKQDISSMTNGTYGSQPLLSSDGKFLLFAGYNGSNGNGTATTMGYRQALLTPNTIELLDTNTFKRYQLPNLPSSNSYADVQWDKVTGTVIISILSSDTKQMGVYAYDLGNLSSKQIPLPFVNGAQYGYITQLNDKSALIGVQSTDQSNLGNLGDTYALEYTQLAIVDDNSKLTIVPIKDPFIQYISMLPPNYFSKVLGAQTPNQVTPSQPTIPFALLQGTNNTQNNNFSLKSNLATTRMQGISNPISCPNLGNARCGALGLTPNSTAYAICQTIEKANNRTANACY